MGLLAALLDQLPTQYLEAQPKHVLILLALGSFIASAIFLNVLSQLIRDRTRGTDPPLVFHWVPFIGSTISYGIDPYKFFFNCRQKYGDVFTFILLGKKTTVCLGTKGNDFILNGKLKDVNAEEIYSPLTTPVFGSDVVYDCPNSKLMEQKKFVKFGLTSEALRSYVKLIAAETRAFAKTKHFPGDKGTINLPAAMAELTIYTASRSLQGKEVRDSFDSTFADLYHDLDMGFSPINFMMPWAPLPQNRKRDIAQKKMAQTYMNIITARRKAEAEGQTVREEDMIWNLMGCKYKNGQTIPDKEIAHMMIALLMAGQHSSSATSSWILLRLASRPEIIEELLEEQKQVLGSDLPELTYEDLQRLPLHAQVVKETLRLHSPIHSIMRKVKQPMPIEGTPFVIPDTHVLLAAPGVTSRVDEYFPEPELWEPHRWDAEGNSEKSSSKYDSLKPKIAAADEEEETFDYGYGLVSKGAKSPYLPFGAGRHRCIGEQFAYVQLQTILAEFVRIFKLRNPKGREGVPGTDYSSLFSRPLNPATVEWEKREKSEKQ
ncbi:eburicol 14 alpha-demethylase [Myriangium duriaei CBS 260.36]|uniref:Eburicol 14 alpha-demethylase n=1 Tax=Myriangium duriaei CBS 260.36 TaxID=1168546 RepID=A0A9P4JBM8_9PEZI|nr:eburicol 14 alpha-demethylase [Myriangium duriaei CBS 260.36]